MILLIPIAIGMISVMAVRQLECEQVHIHTKALKGLHH